MKARIYLRVAKNGYKTKVDAGIKARNTPLHQQGYNGDKTFLPTVAFAVDFEIPDNLFNKAVQVIGTMNVTEKDAVVAAEVPSVKQLKTEKNAK